MSSIVGKSYRCKFGIAIPTGRDGMMASAGPSLVISGAKTGSKSQNPLRQVLGDGWILHAREFLCRGVRMDVGRRADVRKPRVMGGLNKFELDVSNNMSRHEVE